MNAVDLLQPLELASGGCCFFGVTGGLIEAEELVADRRVGRGAWGGGFEGLDGVGGAVEIGVDARGKLGGLRVGYFDGKSLFGVGEGGGGIIAGEAEAGEAELREELGGGFGIVRGGFIGVAGALQAVAEEGVEARIGGAASEGETEPADSFGRVIDVGVVVAAEVVVGTEVIGVAADGFGHLIAEEEVLAEEVVGDAEGFGFVERTERADGGGSVITDDGEDALPEIARGGGFGGGELGGAGEIAGKKSLANGGFGRREERRQVLRLGHGERVAYYEQHEDDGLPGDAVHSVQPSIVLSVFTGFAGADAGGV